MLRERGTQLQLLEPLPVKVVSGWVSSDTWSWENHFLEMAFQMVLKINLLKSLGQLCMLTKFANKLVYSTKCQKPSLNIQRNASII